MNKLIHYESACRELALAASVDEAKDWADKAAALRAYARQAHNTDMEVQVAEIRLRALRRLGELSKELEKADQSERGQDGRFPTAGKTAKADTLREAGISTSAAHRCEQLADVPQEEFEGYLAEQRDAKEPASASGIVARNRGNLSVHFSSDTSEHYSPAWVLEKVSAVMGGIDLDPCSNSHENPSVPAQTHFTRADDGLSREWHGCVFMNPPYGAEIDKWTKKLTDEITAGRVSQAIALVPARTDTAWWNDLVNTGWPVVHFFKGRLRFSEARNGAPFPSALLYWGERRTLFVEEMISSGISFFPLASPEMAYCMLGEDEEEAA